MSFWVHFFCLIVKILTTQALLILTLSGREFGETVKLTRFDSSWFSIDIIFETDLVHISPLTWVYVLFLLISLLRLILYPIKNMSLRHWCHCELLLEWSVGMSYDHISVYVAVLMVKSPALNSWCSNLWCFRLKLSSRHLKSYLQSFNWCPLDKQLKRSLLSNTKFL